MLLHLKTMTVQKKIIKFKEMTLIIYVRGPSMQSYVAKHVTLHSSESQVKVMNMPALWPQCSVDVITAVDSIQTKFLGCSCSLQQCNDYPPIAKDCR